MAPTPRVSSCGLSVALGHPLAFSQPSLGLRPAVPWPSATQPVAFIHPMAFKKPLKASKSPLAFGQPSPGLQLAVPWPSASRPVAFGHTTCGLRPSHGLLEALESIKITKKCPKRKNVHLPRQFTQPPGGQIKKRQSHSVRLDQKSISAKFRPNLLTFEATSVTKTDERRRTPCNLEVASRLWIGGLRPLGGFAS